MKLKLQNLNKQVTKTKRRSARRWTIIFSISGFFLIVGCFFLLTYFPARDAYASIMDLKKSGDAFSITSGTSTKDLQNKVVELRAANEKFSKSLERMPWVKYFPYVGRYYHDAEKISSALRHELDTVDLTLSLIQPYLDEALSSPTTGKEQPNRIVQLYDILNALNPQLDAIVAGLAQAEEDVVSIDPSTYPEKVKNIEVRSQVAALKTSIIDLHKNAVEAKPFLQIISSLLGVPDAKTYLMVFQNDKELRATGGFLSSYAFIKLDQGKITTSTSQDMYTLSRSIVSACETRDCDFVPPAAIRKYLPNSDGSKRAFWSILDVNFSPDVPTAMREFERMYSVIPGGKKYDGIILVDTHVLEKLMKITGPMTIDGTEFSLEKQKVCNCSKVIYELERYAELLNPNDPGRKSIIGELMQEMLTKTLSSPSQELPLLVQTIIGLLQDKHLLLYMHDATAQSALTGLHWTGEIRPATQDYLHINDSNFGGKKSNLYIQEEMKLDISTPKNGISHHRLSITYTNPQPNDGWLNHIYHAYIRVYVPKGSVLTSSDGSISKVTTIQEELGKSAFEAFVKVNPKGNQTLTLEYDVPVTGQESMQLLVQQQPGKNAFPYTISVDGKIQEEFSLSSDKELTISF